MTEFEFHIERKNRTDLRQLLFVVVVDDHVDVAGCVLVCGLLSTLVSCYHLIN